MLTGSSCSPIGGHSAFWIDLTTFQIGRASHLANLTGTMRKEIYHQLLELIVRFWS